MLDHFEHLIYLNDNCPPKNQYVLTNCVNIINQVYEGLRKKYRIAKYVDNEKTFRDCLKENDVDDIYVNDLPEVSRGILKSCNDNYPKILEKRIANLKSFFNLEA